jgi:hypothetical protein
MLKIWVDGRASRETVGQTDSGVLKELCNANNVRKGIERPLHPTFDVRAQPLQTFIQTIPRSCTGSLKCDEDTT